MSINETVSVRSVGSEISDDPRVHDSSCHYFQYKQVHSKGLRLEEQVKQRLRDDLLRRRGKSQPAVAQIDKEVTEAMSESGIIQQYLKTKLEVYDSYTPLLKSFCSCQSAKVNIGQKLKGEQLTKAPEHRVAVDEMRQIQEVPQRPLVMERVQKFEEKSAQENRDVLDVGGLGHHATMPFIKPSTEGKPGTSGITQPGRHGYTHGQLNSLKEVGLDLSEDETDDEELENKDPEANVGDVLPSTVENGMDFEIVDNEMKPDDETEPNSSVHNFNVNPHDELDYSDD